MLRNRVSRLAALAGIDGAVFYSLLTKAWQAGAGVVTLLLLARVLTPREQGIYYTFASVLALQIFFELGFSFIVMQFASHERAGTHWTPDRMLVGDPTARGRIDSLVKLATKWYSCAAGALILFIVPAGIFFFNAKHAELSGVNWLGAWVLLSVFSAGSLATTPFFSILEGLGLVTNVAAFRALQEIICGVLLWASLYSGLGLYSACIYQGGRFLCGLIWLTLHYRPFFGVALRSESKASIDWATEIWPLQWKISLSWISGYLVNQLFVPVAFLLEGAVVAGRFGMSLSLVNGLSGATLAWMTTKAPRFGLLVAQEKYAELDSLFRHTLRRCFVLSFLGAGAIWGGTMVLHHTGSVIGKRLLGPTDMLLLLVSILAAIVMSAEAIYLRAHKREPFLTLSIVNGVSTAASAILFGHYWGVRGMLGAYCTIMLLGGVVWGTVIFRNKRTLWHSSTLQ